MNKYESCRRQIKYNKAYAEAVDNTKKITGHNYENKLTNKCLIDNRLLSFIGETTLEICERNPNFLAGQCISVHWQLAKEIRKSFGIDAFVTLGEVVIFEKKAYFFDFPAAKTLFDSGNSYGTIRSFPGHAWITLVSGEIIDASIQTTIGMMQKDKQYYGNIIAQKAGTINDSIKYIPVVMGEEYLFGSRLVQKITHS